MNSNIELQNRQILSQTDWDKMYPKTDYTNKTEHVKTHTLHYLLKLNQPDTTILPYIEKNKKNNFSILIRADKKNSNLTPLLIATMKGRVKVVQVLLGACKIDGKALSLHKDGYGWTVLHHAKISSREVYEFLISHGADSKVTNSLHGLPDDIRSLIEHDVKPLSMHRTLFRCESGDVIAVSEMSKEKMLELMGINEYRDHPYYPDNELKGLWQLPGRKQTRADLMYKLYLQNPPLLTIQPCKELKGKVEHALELSAGEDVKFGSIIYEYSGIVNQKINTPKSFVQYFNPEYVKATEYLYKNVDAREVGNVSRFANWGWPNCVQVEILDKGTPRQVFFVIDPKGIKKGEAIHFNYGITYAHLAFGAQTLLGRDKMHAYFAKCDLKTHIASIQKPEELVYDSLNGGIKAAALLCYLLFPLNTPSAFLDLHFSGIITVDEWMEQWTKGQEFIYGWASENPVFCHRVQSMMFRLDDFEKALSKSPELKKKFGEWVQNKIGDLSVMQILKAMEYVVRYGLKTKDITFREEYWNDLQRFLEKEMTLYDWTKDEDAPIGSKSVVNDQVQLNARLWEEGSLKLEAILVQFLEGLKHWSNYPDKEEYEYYQDLLKVAEGLGIKEILLALYKKHNS